MLSYTVAVFFLLITPGPGVLTTAGVGAAYGLRAGTSYMLGIVIGGNLVMIAIATGLAAAVFALPYVREVLLAGSAAYLLYLALRIAVSGSNIAFLETQSAPNFWNGILLQVINPKAYAVGTTLFSGFGFWPENLAAETTIKLAIQLAVALPIHVIWLYAGASLKRLDLSAPATRSINIAMAVSMVAVFALAILV